MVNILNKCKINRTAFTLAEVLITLGVIGIVAAITIPQLMNNYKEKVIVNTLPEIYSILNQAYKMSIEDNGPISDWGIDPRDGNASTMIIEKFIPYMKNYAICDEKKCKMTLLIRDLQGKSTNAALEYSMIIGNTTKINIDNRGNYSPYLTVTDCNGDAACYNILDSGGGVQERTPHTIMVNVTGKTNRPRWGEDLFLFAILDRGIIPYGDVGHGKAECCNPEKASNAGWWSGATCAGYVLKHKNLNYLRCVKGDKKYCTGAYLP